MAGSSIGAKGGAAAGFTASRTVSDSIGGGGVRRREQTGSRCLFRRLLPRRIPQSRGVRLSRVEDGDGSTSRAVGASITTSELRSSATAAATGLSIASILSLVVGAVSNTPPHALQNRFDRWFSKPHSGQTLSRPTNPAWGLPGIAPTGAPHCEQNFLPRLIADPHRGQGRARVAPAVGRGCSAFKAKPAPNGCDGEGLPEGSRHRFDGRLTIAVA